MLPPTEARGHTVLREDQKPPLLSQRATRGPLGWPFGKTLSASLSCLHFKQREKVPAPALPATRANPVSVRPPPNLINRLSCETLSCPPRDRVPPPPEADKISCRYSRGPPPLGPAPRPRRRPPPRDLIFRREIGRRRLGPERLPGQTRRPRSGRQGGLTLLIRAGPQRPAGRGDYRARACGVRPVSVTQTD